MSKKVSNFRPDERNEGGKTQIFEHMVKHQENLIKMKPMVKSQIKNVSKVIVAKKAKKKDFHEFDEVIESFKRAATVKGNNLSKPPETLEIKHMLTKKKGSENDFIKQQHKLNLESQKRRIASLGTMNQRKKNNFDPVANPVYFYRKPQSPHNDISIVPFYTKLGLDPAEIQGLSLAKQLENKENREFNLSKNRKYQTNNEKNKTIEPVNSKIDYETLKLKANFQNFHRINTTGTIKPKKPKTEADFVSAPTVSGNSEEDYLYLKRQIIDLIVENRVYKEEKLNDLFERTALLNEHLEKDRLDDIFGLIMAELER